MEVKLKHVVHVLREKRESVIGRVPGSMSEVTKKEERSSWRSSGERSKAADSTQYIEHTESKVSTVYDDTEFKPFIC